MTDTNKLAELIKQAKSKMYGKTFTCELERNMFFADYLLANGVIVQKQGEWKIKRDDCDFEYMMCSCCKEEFFPEGCVVEITPNFCPNCGAKMKGCEGK